MSERERAARKVQQRNKDSVGWGAVWKRRVFGPGQRWTGAGRGPESVQKASRLNDAAVEPTLTASDWGHAWMAAPDAVRAAVDEHRPPPELSVAPRALIDRVTTVSGELLRLLEEGQPLVPAQIGTRDRHA